MTRTGGSASNRARAAAASVTSAHRSGGIATGPPKISCVRAGVSARTTGGIDGTASATYRSRNAFHSDSTWGAKPSACRPL